MESTQSPVRGFKEEIWLPVPDWNGLYEASNLGNVRSLDRFIQRKQNGFIQPGRVLLHNVTPRGYATVVLCGNGNKIRLLVHRLVALAFLNKAELDTQVNHIDGNKLNTIALII